LSFSLGPELEVAMKCALLGKRIVTTGFLYGTTEIIIYVVFLVLMLVATDAGLVQGASSKPAPESGGEVRWLAGGGCGSSRGVKRIRIGLWIPHRNGASINTNPD
jgi:hypothetical protein